MRLMQGRAAAAVAAATVLLAGCQLLGPTSINLGRDRYNRIIQGTAMEQTMSNIVRVYQNEPTSFLDVSEVDATVSVSGSVNGGGSGIGSKGTHSTTAGTLQGAVGAVTGTFAYSETPTIRYLPLLGQALVAQLITPVSADALGLLYDSYWSPASILDLASAYLTLDGKQFYPALDTIIELDQRGALQIAADQSGPPKPVSSETAVKPGGTDKTAATGHSNDALFLFLRPVRDRRSLQLWIRLLRIYAGSQPRLELTSAAAARCTALGLAPDRSTGGIDPDELKKWDVGIAQKSQQELKEAIACLPNSVELRIVPRQRQAPAGKGEKPATAGADLVTRMPLMRTYSALGIMKNAVGRPHPRIEFVTPEQYRAIRDTRTHPWNASVADLSYYVLLPGDEDSVDCDAAARQTGCDDPLPTPGPGRDKALAIRQRLTEWLQRSGSAAGADQYPGDLVVYETPGVDVLSPEYEDINRQLGFLRRYMLIVVSDQAPTSAYVSYNARDRWYYIAGDDPVSQRNFDLMSLFMTMMAIPPSTQPLSPVISVGG